MQKGRRLVGGNSIHRLLSVMKAAISSSDVTFNASSVCLNLQLSQTDKENQGTGEKAGKSENPACELFSIERFSLS